MTFFAGSLDANRDAAVRQMLRKLYELGIRGITLLLVRHRATQSWAICCCGLFGSVIYDVPFLAPFLASLD